MPQKVSTCIVHLGDDACLEGAAAPHPRCHYSHCHCLTWWKWEDGSQMLHLRWPDLWNAEKLRMEPVAGFHLD